MTDVSDRGERRRVRVVYASAFTSREGYVVGTATQVGKDVVVEFDDGQRAEFRDWEIRDVP